jgi:hypothetical protein
LIEYYWKICLFCGFLNTIITRVFLMIKIQKKIYECTLTYTKLLLMINYAFKKIFFNGINPFI